MKKLLLGLLTVGIVSVIAIGATRAYFTDSATVDDNTFTAGKLDFTLNGDMTETKSIDLGPMEPGVEYGPYEMKVYNKNLPASTMDMKYRFDASRESQTVPGFYGKLNVRAVHGFCDGSYPGDVNPTNDFTGRLADMTWDSTTDSIGSGRLSPNITHCFAFYFELDSSAGNEFQGAGAVVDINVEGTQYINPGWTE